MELLNELTRPYRILIHPTIYPYAIFFDDAMHHFTKDCGAILGLRVASGPNGYGHKPKLSPKADIMWKENRFHKMYDFRSGVKIHTFHLLCQICRSSQIKSVIFDWDKTLSMHAGLDTSVPPTYTAAECYFGGKERMKAIRKFFRLALWKCWEIRIMTSNPAATTHLYYFKRLLVTVCGVWIPIEYVSYPKIKHVASKNRKYGLQCKCQNKKP